MAISNDELKELFENFQWIDDIPEDQKKRDEICLEAKAALLIEANCTSERFPAFIRFAKKSFQENCYHLPENVEFQAKASLYDDRIVNISCDEFEVGKLNPYGKYWGIAYEDAAKHFSHAKPRYSTHYDYPYIVQNNQEFSNPPIDHSGDVINAFYAKYPSLYSICKELTPYKSVAQMCRFWGGTSDVFDKVKPRNMYPDYIWGNNSLQKNTEQEHWTDARLEQYAFQFLIPCQTPLQNDFALNNRCYENWYYHIFPFRNQYGETIMKVVKVYDPETQCKILLPMTTWIRNNSAKSQIFCVPYPADKTPLYNLDKLLAPECETVILCDSIELAEANQNKNDSNKVVFTSFICSAGRYDQVDWSPLLDKELFILVSNHSGISFEAAALKTQELTEYLDENTDLEYKLLVLEVIYEKYRTRGFDNVEDILKMYQENPPQVNSTELLILEYKDEIDEFFQSAEKELNRLPDKWWLKPDVPQEEKRIAEEKNSKPTPIDYIMRPFLVRKEVAMLYAKLKVGKSNLAYSIAARVVAAGYSSSLENLLKEKWWVVPFKYHKVLYLDFENKGTIETKKQIFQSGYFPKGKEEECRNNLIIEDCSSPDIDFSALENHQKLFDMLEDAKNKGIPGKAVDLLIIDTYTAFIRSETPQTAANFKSLINKLRDLNLAILIVHHANAENEIRGLKSKLDSFYMTLNLSCDDSVPEGDLTEQARILKYENPREVMSAKARAPFSIKFNSDKRRWYVVTEDKKGNILIDENAELAHIKADYEKSKFKRDAICQMVGLQKTALSDRVKKAPKQK